MLGALMLAAGSSQRFGEDKRLATLPDGTRLLDAAIRAALTEFEDVLVVLRCDDDELARQVTERFRAQPARCFLAPDSALGMGRSLANAMPLASDWEAAFIFLADMPFARPVTLRALRTAMRDGDAPIVVPTHQGARGHPVGFHRRYFAELAQLEGDLGARAVVEAHPDKVVPVAVYDEGVIRDIDTRADLTLAAEDPLPQG